MLQAVSYLRLSLVLSSQSCSLFALLNVYRFGQLYISRTFLLTSHLQMRALTCGPASVPATLCYGFKLGIILRSIPPLTYLFSLIFPTSRSPKLCHLSAMSQSPDVGARLDQMHLSCSKFGTHFLCTICNAILLLPLADLMSPNYAMQQLMSEPSLFTTAPGPPIFLYLRMVPFQLSPISSQLFSSCSPQTRSTLHRSCLKVPCPLHERCSCKT